MIENIVQKEKMIELAEKEQKQAKRRKMDRGAR